MDADKDGVISVSEFMDACIKVSVGYWSVYEHVQKGTCWLLVGLRACVEGYVLVIGQFTGTCRKVCVDY